jgi:hypothetical protein
VPAEVFRTVQKRVWNRTVQKCSTGTLVTSFHFDTVFVGAAGAHAAGPRCHTMARRRPASRPGDGRNQIQLSNQQKNKHAHDLPPLSPLHTYSCTRSTHVAAHGRESTWHDQKEVTRATQACRGTCNHQCLEHFGTLRNTSGTLRYGRVGPRWLSCSEVIRTHIEPGTHTSEHFFLFVSILFHGCFGTAPVHFGNTFADDQLRSSMRT